MSVFKLMRVVLLLSILFVILLSTWMTENRMAAWERPILVTIYPVMADDEAATERYVQRLEQEIFAEINAFFEREAGPYGDAGIPLPDGEAGLRPAARGARSGGPAGHRLVEPEDALVVHA